MERSEWSKNLRKLLECPICYEIKGQIFLCKLGHNICEVCMMRINRCPVCQNGFLTTRNYCAESISLMFNNLQKDFDDIEKNFEKTDLSKNENSSLTHKFDLLSELGTAVNRSWGTFPCMIEDCTFVGCVGAIVHHFDNKHPEIYERVSDSTLPISKKWVVNYVKGPKVINKSFFIMNVGFFIFHVNINEHGCLRGTILMYASRSVAKKISYRFEVTNGKQTWKLKTRKTQTCRTQLDNVYPTCLTISAEEILGNSNTQAVPLTCTVFLKQQVLR